MPPLLKSYFYTISDVTDEHLLNATYYSPELEEPLESTAMLGNIVHSDSPTHVETAGSVGKSKNNIKFARKFFFIIFHLKSFRNQCAITF